MSGIFSSELHKFFQADWEGQKDEKKKPQQELFSTFHQLEAGSKLCRAGTLQTTAQPQEKNKAPEPLSPPCTQGCGAAHLQNPAASQRCQGRVSALTPNQHSTSPAAAEPRKEERGAAARRQGTRGPALLLCILYINRPSRPFPEEGRAGTQVRDQRYPDTAWGIT